MNLTIKYILVLMTGSLLSLSGFTQTGGESSTLNVSRLQESLKDATFEEKFAAGNTLMEDLLYELALPVWKDLAENYPDNANVQYKYGFCLLHSNVNRREAVPFLEKASEGVSKNYNPLDVREKAAPNETYFYLAQAYHHDYQIDKAKQTFELFKTKVSKKHDLIKKADLHIAQCDNANNEIANKKKYIIENVGNKINGEYSDFAPVITLDESALFFTSRRVREDSINENIYSPQDGKHFEDVYVSYWDPSNSVWGKPEVLALSNPRRNEATISVSIDGQILYIYRDDNGDGNIYYSENEGDEYGTLNYINSDFDDINTEAWETHATLSADGKTLYFVSDRKGGMGGRDIYRSVRLPNGKWSKALNLGAPINTENDEDSPFFHPDKKTLFFSSNGQKSMGGFDIFFTKIKEDGTWEEPINMGYPLNTVDDDVFFVTNASGTKGYFASAKQGGYGEKDIYTVTFKDPKTEGVAVLKGYIKNASGDPIPANTYVLVTNLTEGGDPDTYAVRSRDGGYVMDLDPCIEYRVEYFANDEKFYEDQFKVPCEGGSYQEFGNTLNLDEIILESKYKWQIYKNDKKLVDGGIKANYLDEYGSVIFTEPIGSDGTYKYHKVDPELFDLQLKDPTDCDKIDLVLLDDKEQEIRRIKTNKGCVFGTEKDFNEAPKWKYQVLVDGRPLDRGVANYMVIGSDSPLYSETISDEGIFKYHKLDGDDGHIFEIAMDDPTLCDKLEIRLLDESNKVIRVVKQTITCKKSTEVVAAAYFEKFYGYNIKGIASDEGRWKTFLKEAKAMADANGVIHLTIEGSASYVPTRKFKTNTNLSKKRAEDAKNMAIKGLVAAGVSKDKIKVDVVRNKVQGPRYKRDYKNKEKYGPYQYIKIWAK